ncbi:MAG TPA: phospholipase D-like domain-containing protein [Polyangia bacterium]
MPDSNSTAAISADPTSPLATSALVEQAFTRACGAPLVKGNAVRLLKDGKANYAAWVEAIGAARRSVFFENYIIEDDEVGRELASALAERARAGVKVRLVRDWLGSLGGASGRFWRTLTAAGAEVRVFNRPRIGSPLGWLSRDHRKTIAVDGDVAFVTGLCVSNRWLGDPKRGIPPWRDTGVEIRGPAVGFVERAFAEVWATVGGQIPADELAEPSQLSVMGDVPVRVIAGTPRKAELFRIDQLIACAAQRTLWLTDAYFVGFGPYVQALCAAAQDGVDVRLLVPSASDLPLVAALSRAGYRPLIEAGVRVFEWNGSMLHAKTAVADGRWARVGSSNLNLASFISNYEIDVAIEHDGLAREMEAMYLADLENATEIVVDPKRRVVPERTPAESSEESTVGPRGASGRAVGAVRFAHAVGNVIIRSRLVGFAQSSLMVVFGALLLALTAVSVLWPRVVASPLAVLAAWLGVALVVNGVRLRRRRRRVDRASA